MCHYGHRSHPDPFYMPGLQDISVHIDFSAIKAAGVEGGLEPLGYCAQGSFLLSLGLLDDLAEMQSKGDLPAAMELAQQVKKLTMPHEMGELFKVIAFGKNCSVPLSGFSMQNHIDRL